MKTENYLKRMEEYEKSFDELWTKIVEDTNQFIQENPDIGMYSMQSTRVEKLIDSLCLSGAWIHDRIEKKSGVSSSPNYRGSLSKKIRKALGYTY